MSWQGKGSTRAWRQARLRVLERDGHACQLQGPNCQGRATEVHHVQGRGVSEADRDLLASCRVCNGEAGDPTAGDPDPIIRTKW